MNKAVLYTLSEVAITLAGFSEVVVAFRIGAHTWSAIQIRLLWLLIGDSFLVLFFSMLPIIYFYSRIGLKQLFGFSAAQYSALSSLQAICWHFTERSIRSVDSSITRGN
jgi:hypothetical protein